MVRIIICNACFTTIQDDQLIKCEQQFYHKRCFVCIRCGRSLLLATGTDTAASSSAFSSNIYIENENRLLCVQCSPPLSNVSCCSCTQRIKDRHYLRIKLDYHVNCFRCAGPCERPIFADNSSGGRFLIANNKFYCEQDYYKIFLKCAACGEAILPVTSSLQLASSNTTDDQATIKFIVYGNSKYHFKCFVCHYCQRPLHETIAISTRSAVCPTTENESNGAPRQFFVLNGNRCCTQCIGMAVIKANQQQQKNFQLPS